MTAEPQQDGKPLPLAGVRVLEFSQLIMGPVAGLVMADLGADVIKIETAPDGDPTRNLTGFTSGFSDYFNRNKRSVAIDLKHPESKAIVSALCRDADVIIENFAPGTMDRLGCGYEAIAAAHPQIVYCSLKGFLPGPYDKRTALDEAVQFMGGLAYMTGPPGMPLRAGSSVVDLMGGTIAVVAIMAALTERARTGRGQLVQTGLFESVVFMMGQHMSASAMTGRDIPPMPAREGGWSIYQLFQTADNESMFIAVTSDQLWRRFCGAFDLADLAADPRLDTNELRLQERPWLIPRLKDVIATHTSAEVAARCDRAAVPFANVATVRSLFADPHLRESGALLDIVMKNGEHARLPGLPIKLDGRMPGVRRQPPRVGEHTYEVLLASGVTEARVRALVEAGALAAS